MVHNITSAVYNLGLIIIIGWVALIYIHCRRQPCSWHRIGIAAGYLLCIVLCAWVARVPLSHNTVLWPIIVLIVTVLLWYDIEPKGLNVGIPIILGLMGLGGGWVTERIRNIDVPGYWFMMGSFVGMTILLLMVGFFVTAITRLKVIEGSNTRK